MIITFGQYAGRDIRDIPEDYCLWLAREARDPLVRHAARKQLGLQDEAAWLVSAARALPGIVLEFESELGLWSTGWSDAEMRVIKGTCELLRRICARTTGQDWLVDDDEPPTADEPPGGAS